MSGGPLLDYHRPDPLRPRHYVAAAVAAALAFGGVWTAAAAGLIGTDQDRWDTLLALLVPLAIAIPAAVLMFRAVLLAFRPGRRSGGQ